jgi:hypothetical protein
MIKVFGMCAVATLSSACSAQRYSLRERLRPSRQSGSIGADRWDGSKQAPDCSHLAWRDYDNACGYGVQWPAGAAHK